jgi:hypothetical protein
MKTILKYKLDILDNQYIYISMPIGAKILCVQEQGTDLCLWVLADTISEPLVSRQIRAVSRQIRIIGTGYVADDCYGEGYIGTVQMKDGYVWHVFDATGI